VTAPPRDAGGVESDRLSYLFSSYRFVAGSSVARPVKVRPRPQTTVHADRRFVDNGRVVCSAGIAASIDMSLHVLARLLGSDVAVRTGEQMEYPWQPTV